MRIEVLTGITIQKKYVLKIKRSSIHRINYLSLLDIENVNRRGSSSLFFVITNSNLVGAMFLSYMLNKITKRNWWKIFRFNWWKIPI